MEVELVNLGGERDTGRRVGQPPLRVILFHGKNMKNGMMYTRIMPLMELCTDTLIPKRHSRVMLILQHIPLVMGMTRMAYSAWGRGRGNLSVIDAETGICPQSGAH